MTPKKTPPSAAEKPAAATKKPAPAKTSKSTALVPWEEQMKAKAALKAKAEVVQTGFKKIGTRGGILTIDDEPIEDNCLDVIIIASCHENQWYETEFNPNKATVPSCYAFSDPEAEVPEDQMAPVKEDVDGGPHAVDNPQGDDNGLCAACWANEWSSDPKGGRGKACKNIRRLLVVTSDAIESAEALAEAEVRGLNVPVMSAKGWSKYVNMLNDDMGRPPEAVVTTIKLVPDAKSQFLVTFKFDTLVNFDQPLWDAMQAKVAEANKDIVAPYPKQADLDAMQPEKPVRPQGRMAQAMAKGKGATKPSGPADKTAPAKKGKF